MRTKIVATLLVVIGLVATAAFPCDAAARTRSDASSTEGKDVYTGTLVGIGGAEGGRMWPFTLVIDRYTTEAEAREDEQILASGGQDALLDAIRKEHVGSFALAGQVGRTVNFAFVTDTPEGRKITVLFDRWERLFEITNNTRSLDYPFTYLEFSLDRDGKGGGTVIGLAKVRTDREGSNVFDVENFGVYPVRLVNVELRQK